MNDGVEDRSGASNGFESPLVGRHRQALALTSLLFLVTLTIGLVRVISPANLGRNHLDIPAVQCGIDPNTARWYELAQLPGVGESLSKKIVDYRDTKRSASTNSDPRAFRSANDLLSVSGIGPRTLARISQFLIFPPPREMERTRVAGPVDSSFHRR
jgi:hypothetical protein